MHGKRMNITIVVTMLVLFLACGLVILFQCAANIREEMLPQVSQAAEAALENFTEVNRAMEGVTDEREVALNYQKAMVYNDDGKSASYPFRCGSFLYNVYGEIAYQSRTVMYADIVWMDGTEEEIPLVFEYENTADVAQIIHYQEYITHAATIGYAQFTGYWKDGLFYIRRLNTSGYIENHESPLEEPEDVEIETIHLRVRSGYRTDLDTVNARSFTLRVAEKSYAGEDGFATYAGKWKKTDELMDEYKNRMDDLAGEVGYYLIRNNEISKFWDNSLLHTKYAAKCVALEYREDTPSDRMYYVYVAEFSPLRLALRELLGNGAVVVLIALFLCAVAFLQTMYNYTRASERRGYLDEIARQKQALEYAKGAEKSRRAMTSAIAHELKTPIAVLSSYSEALQENIDVEKQSHYLSVIREETEKMDRMVLELLDLSRLEAGKYKLKREIFNLEELAKEIIIPLESRIQEKDIHISWQVGDPMVNADRYRMGQVVQNFMTNAIRHTPSGGKIVLRIGTERETLSVENQGKQLPTGQLSQVWETFWQGDASRNEKGSGLGLSICRSIISLHGGSCKAENTAAGVRFSVNLNAEKKLRQSSRMPGEMLVRLEYPVAQAYTTVENVMRRLELLEGRALQRELKAGRIRIGGDVVRDPKAKLYPHYVLGWKEFRIKVCLNDTQKRKILLFERMVSGDPVNFDAFRASGYAYRKW